MTLRFHQRLLALRAQGNRTFRLIEVTILECQKDNTPLIAAGLAFYALLSLAPALWVVVGVAGIVYGREAARQEVVDSLRSVADPRIARVVGNILDQLAGGGSYVTVLGAASMLFGATLVFAALQDSLNFIWDVPSRDRGYVRDYLVKRVLSFALVLLVGLYLFISVLARAALAVVERFIPSRLPVAGILVDFVGFSASFVLLTLLFAVLYRTLPDREILWRDVWIGAVVTAALVGVGKALIALYLGHATLSSAYGTAGSLIVFLLWMYYSSQVFLFGAEFTEVYARLGGGRPGNPSTRHRPDPAGSTAALELRTLGIPARRTPPSRR